MREKSVEIFARDFVFVFPCNYISNVLFLLSNVLSNVLYYCLHGEEQNSFCCSFLVLFCLTGSADFNFWLIVNESVFREIDYCYFRTDVFYYTYSLSITYLLCTK